MGRYIDRDLLIDKLPTVDANCNKKITLVGAVRDFIEIIFDMPEVDVVEAKHGNWIEVENQLPSAKGKYIVAYYPVKWKKVDERMSISEISKKIQIGIDAYCGGKGIYKCWKRSQSQRVIAWMPLPEYEVRDTS